jgi:TrmH family RNA methyltransferase|nr:RNA methyltransferase [Ruminococcus bromii]
MTILSSKDNSNIKNAVKLRKSAKYRRESGLFIAEGVRICMDAMLSKACIDTFFASEKAGEKYADDFLKLQKYSDKTFIVSDKIFNQMCDTESPQGFLCVIKALDKTACFDKIKTGDKFLALDNLQDPGNLGTILRTAEALNVTGIVLSADCCDIYSPKVVRGSMGAVFRLPFVVSDTISGYLNAHSELESYAAVVSALADKITTTPFVSPCIVAVGNEGNGLKEETISACKHKITIPMEGRAESLNAAVAASIIMWEMMK